MKTNRGNGSIERVIPKVCLWPGSDTMDSYKETESYHLFRRRGLLFIWILQEIPIRINDHQLLW